MVDVGQVALGHLGHIGAAPHLHGDQAFGGQHFERFAQGRAADAVGFGNFQLVNPAAGLQFTIENSLTQQFSNLFIEGTGEREKVRPWPEL